MNDAITQITASSLHNFITSNSWVWPTLEMIHFFGLCLLFGSLLVIDLRSLGFAKKIPLATVDVLITITLIGFALNLMTGLLFVIGDPGRYFVNIAFKIKMGLIVIAGLNALFYFISVQPKIQVGPNSKDLPAYAKVVALLSLLLWTSVIVLGRMIPYVEDL